MSVKQVQKFNQEHRLSVCEKVSYGYKDAGRSANFSNDGNLLNHGGREIIVVKSPEEDPSLKHAIDTAQRKTKNMNNIEEKARFLNKFVDNLLKEDDVTRNKELMSEKVGQSYIGQEISLGQIIEAGTGVCRHRSLLFKVLGDEIGVPSSLVRGNYSSPTASGGHAWNEVELEDGQRLLVDVMNDRILDLDDPKAERYRDMQEKPMYDKMSPPANTTGHHKWDIIEKGDKAGVQVNIQGWSEKKKNHLLNDLKYMGLAAEEKTSSVDNQPVIRVMGEVESALIANQMAQEKQHSNTPAQDLVNASWLDATNRHGEKAQYLDTSNLSEYEVTNLQRTLYSEGINFEMKESKANGGMQVMSVTGDDLKTLEALQYDIEVKQAREFLHKPALEANKIHIPANAPAQQAPQVAKNSKRLSGKVAGLINKIKPSAGKLKL